MSIDFKNSISDPIAVDVGNYVTQGRIVSKTIQLASFTTNENAVWAAKHQLQKESYSFAEISIPVNRNLFRLQVGDCFKFSYAKYGISNMICRVLQISEENLELEEITISAMEDVFGVSNSITEYTAPVSHTIKKPIYSLSPFTHQVVFEAPYILSDTIKVLPLACRENDLDLGFDIYLSYDIGASYSLVSRISNLQPYGKLVGIYPANTYTIDEEIGFTVDFVDDVELIETTTWSNVFSAERNIAILGSEIISFRDITPVSGTQYKLENVIRGRFGTQKVAHVADEEFWFIKKEVASAEHSEIVAGVTRKFKLVPYNIKYSGDISEATAIDLSIEGKSKKPYIPINFNANGNSKVARYSTDIELTWSSRYRGKGAGIGIPGTALADVDREGYFEIEVWVSGSKVRITTAIDAISWTYTQVMNIVDNVNLPNEVEFKLLNYRTEEAVTYESDQVSVSCKQGTSIAPIIYVEGEPSGIWTQIGYSFAKARYEAIAVEVGDDFYAGLGQDEYSVELSDWWKYENSSGTWIQKTSFAGGVRAFAVGVECGGKIYAGTGYAGVTGTYKNDWWEYNPATNVWTQKADFGGGFRTQAMAASVGGKVYVGMGYGKSGETTTVERDWWEYDPTADTWTQKADFTEYRAKAITIGVAGKVYFGTGLFHPMYCREDWWEYDPTADTWTQKANWPGGERNDAVIVELGGKIYAGLGIEWSEVGGGYRGTVKKDWWEYTIASDSWVQKANYGYWDLDSRQSACAAKAGGKVQVGLGRCSDKYKREWREYDLAADTWELKNYFGDAVFKPRTGFGAAIENKIYVGSGTGVSGWLKDWWEFDSDLETWLRKADFDGVARYGDTGAEAGGKIYFGTGVGPLKDWWEYTSTTDTWIQKLDFGGAARYGAAAAGYAGKVYMGLGFSSMYERDWWEYNPATNVWTQKADFGLAISGRHSAVAVAMDGYIYVGLGKNAEGCLKDWWAYDIANNAWFQRSDYPETVSSSGAVAVSLGSNIYAGFGGTVSWWKYSPSLDQWVSSVSFSAEARFRPVAVAVGAKIYIGAGYTPGGEYKNDWWKFW